MGYKLETAIGSRMATSETHDTVVTGARMARWTWLGNGQGSEELTVVYCFGTIAR